MNLCLVYITNPNKEEARNVVRHLMDKKLIACANIYSGVNSLYFWQGKLADEEEVVAICKTTEDKYEEVKAEVKKMHSYTCPCIIKIPMEANEDYANWLLDQLK